jgi:hypothetical protein
MTHSKFAAAILTVLLLTGVYFGISELSSPNNSANSSDNSMNNLNASFGDGGPQTVTLNFTYLPNPCYSGPKIGNSYFNETDETVYITTKTVRTCDRNEVAPSVIQELPGSATVSFDASGISPEKVVVRGSGVRRVEKELG